MFLDLTRRRNPALLEAARWLHGTGRIDADTYVIDRDTVSANAAVLAETGRRHGVELWFVAKQYGRNPLLTATIAEHLPLATAIDLREADSLVAAGARLANVGHLVQIPRRRLAGVLAHRPSYVTVYDDGNLAAVAEAARAADLVQPILLKVAGDPQSVFPGQDGGFTLDELHDLPNRARQLDGIRIAGVTGFPCIVYDPDLGATRGTGTLDLVLTAAKSLRDNGLEPVLSLPSHTSVSTIPEIARLGGAFGEPGHALTGTTPQHAVDETLLERPAMIYVSEVAQLGAAPSVFGGGFYPRGRARSLLVETAGGRRAGRLLDAPAENIDYYRRFDWTQEGPPARIGDTALMAFRTQIFVTRSRVAVVSGLSRDQPVVDGIHDSLGQPVRP